MLSWFITLYIASQVALITNSIFLRWLIVVALPVTVFTIYLRVKAEQTLNYLKSITHTHTPKEKE